MTDQIPFDEDRLDTLFEEARKSANEDDPLKMGESFLRVYPEYQWEPGETTESLGQKLIRQRDELRGEFRPTFYPDLPPELQFDIEKIRHEALSVLGSNDPKEIGDAFVRAFPNYDLSESSPEEVGQLLLEEREMMRRLRMEHEMKERMN